MNEDRELLELAAKAAGIEITWEHGQDYPERVEMFRGHLANYEPWNPLTDDGDALRLAVKLGICVEFGDCADDAPVVYAGIAHERRDWPMWPRFPDAMAATRRAIVRAAAELGRSMP